MSGGWVIYTTHQDRKRKIHLNAPNETDQKLCATTEQVRPYATLEPYLCRSDKWGAVLDMIDGWKLSQSIWRYETVGIVWDDGNTYPRGSGRHAEGPLLAYFERCFQAAASCPARYSVHECVQMELYRMDVMRTLRREFFSMLDARRITRPREAFNRWLFEARTFLDTSKSTGVKVKCLVPDEPLIPTIDPTQHNSPSLERELLKACRDRSRQVDEALGKLYTEQVIETLTRRAIEEAKRLSDMRQKLSVCLLAFSPVHVLSSNTKVVLRFEGILHEILPGHYKKFEILYRNAGRDLSRGFQSVESTSSTLVNKSQDQKNEVPLDCPTLRNESAWMDEFHYRLFVLLQRYENATGSRAGVGSGHHAATPPDILDVLHRHMGVVLECFASPINCHFPHYCSAFVDTDVFFGSIGSFFDFYPVEGSFEAGPPYVEELMDAMYTHICSLLSASQRPLSFCLVIPEWKTTPTSVILRIDANAEGFVRRVIVVPRGQHVYADGFQHCLRNTYFRPVHNTLIVVMQNEAGAKKWPCTDALEVEMLTVWKTLAECVAENPLFLVKEDQASLRGSQALGSERDPNAEVYQKRHRETTGDSKRELSPTQHLPLQDQ